MKTELGYTRSLDEHLAEIRSMVDKSLRDGETRQLAVRIVSDAYVWRKDPRTGELQPYIEAWGRHFHPVTPGMALTAPCQPRDAECEIVKVWNFVVANARYVYDPTNIDTFATVRQSLEAGGGDCDDCTIMFCSLLGALGFICTARVVSTSETPDEPEHVYALVALSKDNPEQFVPLDPTMAGYVPGQEYHAIGRAWDFDMRPTP